MSDIALQQKRSSGSVFSSFPRLANLVGWCLLTLCWLPPDHFAPWLSFHSEFVAFAAVGLLVVGTNLRSGLSNAPGLVLWVLAGAVLPWLQFAAGVLEFSGDAALASVFLVGLAFAVCLGYGSSKSQIKVFGALASALWAAALLSACVGLLQWLSMTAPISGFAMPPDGGGRALGNLAQPNQLATLLLMGLVALGYSHEQARIGRLALLLGGGLLTLVLVLTQSRAGMVSVLLVAGFMLLKRRTISSRLKAWQIAAWAIGFFVATALLPLVSEALLLGSARAGGGAYSDRLDIWTQVGHAILQAPWFGYGWNQTAAAQISVAGAHSGAMTYTYAHSVVLDLLLWNGIPLGTLITLACGYWFITRLLRARQIEAVYAMAALLPFAMHSMVEFPFAYSYFLITAGLLIGIVEASTARASPITLNARWLWPILAVWTVVGSLIAVEYFAIEEDFRIVRFENLRLGTTPSSYEVPEIRLLTHMATMLAASRTQPEPGMTPEQIERLRLAARRFAYGALTYRYATALGLNGNPQGASREMALIKGLYGERYYRSTAAAMQELAATKYPQLNAVKLP